MGSTRVCSHDDYHVAPLTNYSGTVSLSLAHQAHQEQIYRVRGHDTIDPNVYIKPDHIFGPRVGTRPPDATSIPEYMGVYLPFFATEYKPREFEFYRSGYQGGLVWLMITI